MATITLDPAIFLARFPGFQGVNSDLLQMYFAEATLLLDPSDQSRVADQAQRQMLLYLLTAHISQLNSGSSGQPASGLVGRVNSATQGSVSVSTDYGTISQNAAWYLQTPFGAQYWALTARYRTMRYVR